MIFLRNTYITYSRTGCTLKHSVAGNRKELLHSESKDKGREAVSEALKDRVAQLPTSQKLSIKTACGVNSLTSPSSHPPIFGNYLLLLEPN